MSRFLPADFDPQGPLAVIAGKGMYPILLLERLKQNAIPYRLIGFEGETDKGLIASVPEEHRAVIKVGQLGKLLKWLGKLGARSSVMAGQITPRRLFDGLHPDLKAITLLAKLKERNAETIFGTIVSEIEKLGIQVLDARVFLDDQLASPGIMSGKQFPEKHIVDFGVHIARSCSELNIGQGVVVSPGTVLAVEAFEGTNAMLRRAGTFGAKETLFIKTIKPGQDFRFDVPVFGMQTLEVMQEAGIQSAALESENTIILEKEAVLKAAHKARITLFGY